MKKQKNNGITLVALVVTIIILLILAGITISQLSGSGLFARARQAVYQQKKARYYEEINLEIYNEHMERNTELKQTAFISDLENKIIIKDWVSSTIKCDEYFEEQNDNYKNTILFIETKDGYEIIVDIDNNTPKAIIREDYFKEVKNKCKVEYNANGGTGNIEAQEVRAGFYTILQRNGFEKINHKFVGWCKYKGGNGELYAEGSKFKVETGTTLYAIWEKESAELTFDSNGGTGIIEGINVSLNTETQLPENIFTRDGYYFLKWNTKADGTGTDYTTTITISEDTTLYAQWEKYLIVTFNANGGTGTISDRNVKKGESLALPYNSFKKEGYRFFSWNTKADGTGTVYTEGKSITVNNNINLFAIWKEPITYADMLSNPANYYGKSINYSANGITNWKIFHVNTDGIFITAGDFIPNSKVPTSKTDIFQFDYYGAGWKSVNYTNTFHNDWTLQKRLFKAIGYTLNSSLINSQCVSQLLNVNNWTEFVNTNYADFAIGAPTLEMWVETWNTIYPNDKLYCNAYNENGYLLGTSSNPTTYTIDRNTMKEKSGFKNKLFYPHPSTYVNNCYGYWIASPGSSNIGGVFYVWNYGEIGVLGYSTSNSPGSTVSIRPTIHLKTTTRIVEKVDGNYALY